MSKMFKYIGPVKGEVRAYGYKFKDKPVKCVDFIHKLDANPEFEEVKAKKSAPKKKAKK